MTLRELAKLANVSVSTVSKAFSGSDEISEDTRNHIFKTAKEYGCYDKYNKNRFDKKVIAVICPEVCSDYYSNYLTVLYEELEKNNCVMTVGVDNFSDVKKCELFAYYSGYCNVDGIIVIGSDADLKNTINIPAVNIGTCHSVKNIDSVSIDFTESVLSAVKHLKDCGHEKIGFAGEKLTTAKTALFIEAVKRYGLSVKDEWILTSEHRFEKAGQEYFESISRLKEKPTAVFAAYDNIAIGIMKAAKRSGVKIPEELSVIGVDDIGVARYLDPPLSTVSGKTETACKIAVDIIMRKLENPYYQNGSCTISAEFIPRDTVYRLK